MAESALASRDPEADQLAAAARAYCVRYGQRELALRALLLQWDAERRTRSRDASGQLEATSVKQSKELERLCAPDLADRSPDGLAVHFSYRVDPAGYLYLPADLVARPELQQLQCPGKYRPDHRQPMGWKWVGLRNYRQLLTNNDHLFRYLASVHGNRGLRVLRCGPGVPAGLRVALLLVRKFPGRGIILTLLLIPMMLAPVVVGLTWRLMWDPGNGEHGVLNNLITWFGLPALDLSLPTPAIAATVIADVWMWTPFMLLIPWPV